MGWIVVISLMFLLICLKKRLGHLQSHFLDVWSVKPKHPNLFIYIYIYIYNFYIYISYIYICVCYSHLSRLVTFFHPGCCPRPSILDHALHLQAAISKRFWVPAKTSQKSDELYLLRCFDFFEASPRWQSKLYQSHRPIGARAHRGS